MSWILIFLVDVHTVSLLSSLWQVDSYLGSMLACFLCPLSSLVRENHWRTNPSKFAGKRVTLTDPQQFSSGDVRMGVVLAANDLDLQCCLNVKLDPAEGESQSGGVVVVVGDGPFWIESLNPLDGLEAIGASNTERLAATFSDPDTYCRKLITKEISECEQLLPYAEIYVSSSATENDFDMGIRLLLRDALESFELLDLLGPADRYLFGGK